MIFAPANERKEAKQQVLDSMYEAMNALREARYHLKNAHHPANMAGLDRTAEQLREHMAPLQEMERQLAITRITIGQSERS